MNKIMQTQKKIEKAVVGCYKKVEDGFVDAFLTPDADSPETGKQCGNNNKERE